MVLSRPQPLPTRTRNGPEIPTIPSRCPYCRGSVVEENEDTLSYLWRNPLTLTLLGKQTTIRGDWVCLSCSKILVDWTNWAQDMEARAAGRMFRNNYTAPRRGRPPGRKPKE